MKRLYKTITVLLLVCLIGGGSVIGASAACTERVIYDVNNYCDNGDDLRVQSNCPQSCGSLYDFLKRCGCSDEQCRQLSELLKAYGICATNCTDNSCNDADSAEIPVTPTEPSATESPMPTQAESTESSSVPATHPTLPSPTVPMETTPAESQSASALSDQELEVVRLINDIRRQNGLSALKVNEELSRVARIKSQDMRNKGYFSHNSPTYGSPFEMMTAFGIRYRTAGENIAVGYRTPQSVVDGWMNSPGHRANILNAKFTEIGMGYVANGNYWTQMFIG